ncbi:hypothetical protein MRX96_045422 [Rhipicephalus microplus]
MFTCTPDSVSSMLMSSSVTNPGASDGRQSFPTQPRFGLATATMPTHAFQSSRGRCGAVKNTGFSGGGFWGSRYLPKNTGLKALAVSSNPCSCRRSAADGGPLAWWGRPKLLALPGCRRRWRRPECGLRRSCVRFGGAVGASSEAEIKSCVIALSSENGVFALAHE